MSANLKRELENRIAVLEALLEWPAEADPQAPPTPPLARHTRADLRRELSACYSVRAGLRRGTFRDNQDLISALRRISLRREHRRFRDLDAIASEEVARVDLDRLARQLSR